jgi:type VI secretion system protein ImpM
MTQPLSLASSSAIGWYGKLPWLGDFVGAGLPWQADWSNALQAGLAEAGAVFGPDGLRQRIRGMAAWQCLLLPPGDAWAWCGIVAGSRDRVGRAFPLLVAEALHRSALDALSPRQLQARALALSDWVYDSAALDSLEAFEQGAAEWLGSPWPAGAPGTPGSEAAATASVAALCARWPAAASFWWCTEPVADVEAPHADDWPPRPALMPRLLGAGRS